MWSTRHADLRSSDYVDINGVANFRVAWHSLENIPAATFCGYDKVGNCYLATLNEPDDCRGTVWSLSSKGEVRWLISSLLPSLTSLAVDEHGNVYVSDGRSLASFDCNGGARWVRESPGETAAVIFLPSGHIFVQNVFGGIRIFDVDGYQVLDNYLLECSAMEDGCGHDHLPGKIGRFLFQKAAERIGVSRRYSKRMIERFLGVGISAKHVPAVVPELNRIIVVVAHGSDSSYIYGLDINLTEPASPVLVTAFTTSVLGGSDTSPAVSFDGLRFYCTDGGGYCYSLSSLSGEVLWKLKLPDMSSASPSTSPDGFVYISVKSQVIAIKEHGSSGEIAWKQDFSLLKPGDKDLRVMANSVLAVNRGYVYCVVSIGKMFLKKLIPHNSCLVSMNRLTGEITGVTTLNHESLCTLSILPNGSLLIPSKPLLYGLERLIERVKSLLLLQKSKPSTFHGLVKLVPVYENITTNE